MLVHYVTPCITQVWLCIIEEIHSMYVVIWMYLLQQLNIHSNIRDQMTDGYMYVGQPTYNYRGSSYLVILQFVIPAISWFYFGPHFMFWRKKSKFYLLFKFFLIYSLLFVYSDCHLMNIKISLLDLTITRNSLWM